LLNGLGTAADIVECIDDPALQRQRGWDLTGWRYRMVQWGVVLTCPGGHGMESSEILVMMGLDGTRIIVAGEPTVRPTLPRMEMLA
jgi:hypothetical protein